MVDPPFCLYSSYPRKIIPGTCLVKEIDAESLISVERSGDYDPVLLYGESQVIIIYYTSQSEIFHKCA